MRANLLDWVQSFGPDRLAEGVAAPVPPGVTSADLTVPGPAEDLPLRVYRPTRSAEAALPLIVHFHGGGWTVGDLDSADWLCRQVADGADAVVLSVDYRLAPKHRFPAAVDDCYAALGWAAAHAGDLGADPDRLAVMGDSCGGNLAAVVCLLARDRSGPAIAHQALLYPPTDLDWDRAPAVSGGGRPPLNLEDLCPFRDLYLGPDGDPTDWRVSPLRAADHAGLPPALVQVGEHDPLREDGIRYAAALRAAGVPVRLRQYDGMPHGYLSGPWTCRGARQALTDLTAEQTRSLAPRARGFRTWRV